MTPALAAVMRRTWARCAPPPTWTVSEWADQERRLPAESSAEPGRWRTDRTPYLRELLDVLTDSKIETVVLMKGAQTGGTEVLLNLIGYTIHVDPGPVLCIEPTLDMASAVSKDRIAPMVRDTPALRSRVATPRAKAGSSTILHRSFPGGTLTLAGANSPASLASRPIRLVLADEVDRWPASLAGEGDPLALAVARTLTFQRRKIVVVSSPTVKGASRIEDWWALSDQRRYHVPCPGCGAGFVITWSTVRWDPGQPETAHLECPHCAGRIEDAERPGMIAAGTWVATATAPGLAGFHLPGLLAPWRSLREHVVAFLAARHSLEARQTWTNTVLGECWEVPGEAVEPGSLLLRREDFGSDGVLPAGVRILTCGVDVQDDRLEYLILGWGGGEEVWTIDRDAIPGDPGRAETWAALDEVLQYDFTTATGRTMRVQCTLVDAGGHKTQAVYSAIMPRQSRRVLASFGRSGGSQGLLVSPPKAIRPRNGSGVVLRRIVDVDQCKALIYSRLRIAEPGPEYVHLGRHCVDETVVDELTAETLVTRRNKYGVPTKVWEQRRDRNETLDAFVLALAALRIMAPTPERFQRLADVLGGPP